MKVSFVSHTIHSFEVCNSVAFSTFMKLGILHHSQFSDIFITLEETPTPLSHHSPKSSSTPASGNQQSSFYFCRFACSRYFMCLKKNG